MGRFSPGARGPVGSNVTRRWSRPNRVLSGCLPVRSAGAATGMTTYVTCRDALQFGVRVERPGRLVRDYQTVVGGAMSAEGKIKVTQSTKEPETVVSPRFYLAGACFLAAVQGEAALIDRLAAAVREPVWPPFWGENRVHWLRPCLLGLAILRRSRRHSVTGLGHLPRMTASFARRSRCRRGRVCVAMTRSIRCRCVPICRATARNCRLTRP